MVGAILGGVAAGAAGSALSSVLSGSGKNKTSSYTPSYVDYEFDTDLSDFNDMVGELMGNLGGWVSTVVGQSPYWLPQNMQAGTQVLKETQEAQYPGISKLRSDVVDLADTWLKGELSQGTKDTVMRGAAERGVRSGQYGSVSRAVGAGGRFPTGITEGDFLRALGLTSEAVQEKGISAYDTISKNAATDAQLAYNFSPIKTIGLDSIIANLSGQMLELQGVKSAGEFSEQQVNSSLDETKWVTQQSVNSANKTANANITSGVVSGLFSLASGAVMGSTLGKGLNSISAKKGQ